MPHSEDDAFRFISDFIKGKSGLDGMDMAKLSWEGREPPTLPPFPKSSDSYGEFLDEYPIVASGLSRCSRPACLALIGAMLTLPELQSNCYRLEVLAHFAALLSNGRARPTAAQICAWFNQLDNGTCGRQEDPAEDLFLSSVYYGSSNYRIFEGIAEGNTFYTQVFLDVLREMPNDGEFLSLKRSVEALLQLSDAIAARANLPRNIVGNPTPRSGISKPRDDVLRELKKRVIFSENDLSELGIHVDALRHFIINDTEISILEQCGPGHGPFECKPIFKADKKLIVSLPTTIGTAIRAFVIGECLEWSLRQALERSLVNAYTSLFTSEEILGELRNPPIQMVDYGAFHASQMTIEVDRGRYVHFLFFVDGLRDYEKGAFLGTNPIEPFSEFAEKSIASVVPQFSSKPGFIEGLSLIVVCGWGRSLALKLPDNETKWRAEVMPAHDFVTLSRHTECKLLDLFRILDARDATEEMGIKVINANGFLNLYSWINSKDGHIVPHEQLEPNFVGEHGAFLIIPQNNLLKVRHDVANAVDIHTVARPDGTTALVRRVNGTPRYGAESLSPFYADIEALNVFNFRCVYKGGRCDFWIESVVDDTLGLEIRYHLSNMVNNWGEVVFRYLDKHGLDNTSDVFLCKFIFLDKSHPKQTDPIPDDVAIGKLVDTNIDKSTSRVDFNIGEGFLAAGRRDDNVAERTVVLALLRACTECVSLGMSDADIARIVDEIIGDVGARHFHAFAAPDIRDHVRDALPRHAQIIERMDDANSRLGLGWLCRDRAAGGDLEGREECCAYLNKLVRAIAERIKKKVVRFDRAELIKLLLVNHEAAANEAMLWKRTFRAIRSLSENKELAAEEAANKIGHLNAASLASRIIAEVALCEAPLKGGMLPSRYDVGGLLADASQMFHLGGYSDCMNAEVMPAKIRISPAGDVLMDHGFTDQVVQPFGRKFQSVTLDDAAARYSEDYREVYEDDTKVDEIPTNPKVGATFEAAWQDEFSFSIPQTQKFVEAFQMLAVEHGEAVLLMPMSDLFSYLAKNTGMHNEAIEKLIELFTLKHRPRWDKAPKGFTDTAWLPWRFRRQLSVVSRPIIQLEETSEATCVLAPAMIVHHIAKFVSDVRFGRVGDKIFRQGSPLSQWVGDITRLQGEAFNRKVLDQLVTIGWKAKANLSDGQILGRASDPRFGDVDVLAWSRKHRRVLVIECKDLSLDKTFGEIARRLARYRGLTDTDGRPDDLKRHLDRCATLYEAREGLSKFVGFDVKDIERVLVFSHPTPMQFHNIPAEYGVCMITIGDIHDWIGQKTDL